MYSSLVYRCGLQHRRAMESHWVILASLRAKLTRTSIILDACLVMSSGGQDFDC